MTRILLHHAQGCALSQSVRMGLAEKGLERELHTVGTATFPQMEPGFLALNSAGQTPVLEADGLVLTEAFFILCWLDEQFPDPALGGADPAERYRILEIGKLVEDAIAPSLALLEWVAAPGTRLPPEALVRLPRERRAWWDKALAGFSAAERSAAEDGLARALDFCEQQLERHPWLAGADFTIADILLFPLAARIDEALLGPALREWRGHVAARPSAYVVATEERTVTLGPERPRWG
jgi:glutathione S-transferase